jgi:hypothetical protein
MAALVSELTMVSHAPRGGPPWHPLEVRPHHVQRWLPHKYEALSDVQPAPPRVTRGQLRFAGDHEHDAAEDSHGE